MEKAHLDELIDLENTYWWHVAKRNLVTQLIQDLFPDGGHVVEGGIGGAGNLMYWQDLGYTVTGLDVMHESVEQAKHRGLGNVYQHDLHEPWPITESSADVVVVLDVLEHLKDPVTALQQAARVLKPHGKVVFTVPCYEWLYSEWDQRLGHFRRYTTSMVREHVSAAGLQIEMLRHWNAFSLPAAIVVRMMNRFGREQGNSEFPRVSPWLNRALISTAGVERRISNALGMPVGLSLVGVIGK